MRLVDLYGHFVCCPYWDEKCQCQITPKAPTALEDAQRAVGLVRLHAAEWHIDPRKIGVLGFSASAIWSRPSARTLKNVCIRQWTLPTSKAAVPALYPGHLWIDTKKFALNADIRVTRNTPPTFLVQAENDNVDSVNHSLVYCIALKNAGVPVEMHLYAHGGHTVGLRPTKLPITD